MRDLISIQDLTPREIGDIFALTDRLKSNPEKFARTLAGKTLALLFQKPSNRTRVSFEVGMYQLGGNAIYLSPEEINLGVREPVRDVARTLSRYVDGIVLRTFGHDNVLELAEYCDKPVINGLSDFSHPCQALADLYTVREKFGSLARRSLAYIGDGNNVCTSLIFACAKTGLELRIASPRGYEPSPGLIRRAIAGNKAARITVSNDPAQAARNADVLYTDVWASMGQEHQARARRNVFKKFRLDKELLKKAKKSALVMHCLPAHRGDEITDEVIDSAQSVVFDQAENRMHVQKAVLIRLLAS
jgi:ornithine carbamoyltransferase